MKNKGTEVLNTILERLKSMSQKEFEDLVNAQFEKIILKKCIVDAFIEEVKQKKFIDSEDVLYFPERYNI